MYYADSDILTIVLAVITMAAGIYSSIKKQQPKDKSAGETVADSDMVSIFSALDKAFGVDEPESDDVDMPQTMEEIRIEREDKSSMKGKEKISVDFEEGVVSTGVMTPAEYQISDPVEVEEGNADLKKLLKTSPKNIVLASEILNPKYKEF